MPKFIPHITMLLLFLLWGGQPLGAVHAHSCNFSIATLAPPVKPATQKKKVNKRFLKKKKKQRHPSMRKWGIFSLTIGGYCLFFAIWGLLFILGGVILIPFMPFIIFGLILGIYLAIRGISWIDQSFITYSEHQDFVKSRMHRSMIFDFIMAGLLLFCVLLFFGIAYYTTATISLFPFLTILFMAFVKLGQLRRWKKGEQG